MALVVWARPAAYLVDELHEDVREHAPGERLPDVPELDAEDLVEQLVHRVARGRVEGAPHVPLGERHEPPQQGEHRVEVEGQAQPFLLVGCHKPSIMDKDRAVFAAITDVELNDGIPLHCFVRDTLRDAGIEPVPLDHFAVWVARLKPMIQ